MSVSHHELKTVIGQRPPDYLYLFGKTLQPFLDLLLLSIHQHNTKTTKTTETFYLRIELSCFLLVDRVPGLLYALLVLHYTGNQTLIEG